MSGTPKYSHAEVRQQQQATQESLQKKQEEAAALEARGRAARYAFQRNAAPVVLGLLVVFTVVAFLTGALTLDEMRAMPGAVLDAAPVPVAEPRSGEVRINPKDGAEMVYVPAGEFIMGITKSQAEALLKRDRRLNREWALGSAPQRKVYLDGFWMYKHEVTVAQYRKFCSETGREMPRKPWWDWKEDHPIVYVSWHDAKAYADWAGVQLPTEAQWEKAARGTDGRDYPWGDDWDPNKCRCSRHLWGDAYGTSPVGSYPAGASPYGCLDMAGNVWEWCADWYDIGYYAEAPNRNPTGPWIGADRVLRGGSWYIDYPNYLRASDRFNGTPDFRGDSVGFRCSSGRS